MSGMAAKSQAVERRSYLLRLHSPADPPSVWRASLQDVRTGEWRHFADLTQLFAFLSEGEPTGSAPEEAPYP